MAKAARKTSELTEVSTKRVKRSARKAKRDTRKGNLDGSAFSSLTRGQKDELLLELLERAGLVDSDGNVSL